MSLVTFGIAANDFATITLPVDSALSSRIMSRLWFGRGDSASAVTLRLTITNYPYDVGLTTFNTTTFAAAGQSNNWEWWEDDKPAFPAANITTMTLAVAGTSACTGTLYCWYIPVPKATRT